MTRRNQDRLGRTFWAEGRASPKALRHKEFGTFTVQEDQLSCNEPGTVMGGEVRNNGGWSEEFKFWIKYTLAPSTEKHRPTDTSVSSISLILM